MGGSKSKNINKNNNQKKNKDITDKINKFFSETAQLLSGDNFESNQVRLNNLIPTIEKSDLGKITDSHVIIEISLDLISKHCHLETYKKANLLLYTSMLYPPLFESDEKTFQINLTKTSNYMQAQRAFDKIKEILWINEDGEYVQREKQLRYKNSTASQGSLNLQKMHTNQSFLSIFNNNNLNASTASYKDYNTDHDKVSVRNYKRNPSKKSNIHDENNRKKSLKSLRTVLINDLPKKLSLNKIKEIHTERNSFESEGLLIGELSPNLELEKNEENKKPQVFNKIRRIDYGYELQKNLLKKIRNININENDNDDTRSKEVNNKEPNKFKRERNLQIHKKLDQPNYSWLKKILNLGKNKTSKKKKFDFKINMKEIVKQAVKEEPDRKSKENGKRSNGKIYRENIVEIKNLTDMNTFNTYLDKYLGIEKTVQTKKKQFSSTSKIPDRPKSISGLLQTNFKKENLNNRPPLNYNSEIINRDDGEANSEYETPDEDNSFKQLKNLKSNYRANYEENSNSSYDSQYYHEYYNFHENGIEESLEGIKLNNYHS